MFQDQQYVTIGTKRRNGATVWTPVWFAAFGDAQTLYVFSAGAAGKVKRIRNFADIQVAPCNVSGKVTGAIVPAQAWLEDDATICENAYAALRAKYGWQMVLLDFFSKLSGSFNKRQLLGLSISSVT